MFWQMLFHTFQEIHFLFLENIFQTFEILCTFLEILMNMHWNLNFNQNCRFSTQNNNFLKSWQRESIEFSLNVFTKFAEFSDKIFVITVKGLKPDTQPPLALETRVLPQCQQDTCRDRIFKLSPIHALVIYQIPWIQWIPVPFRENCNGFDTFTKP